MSLDEDYRAYRMATNDEHSIDINSELLFIYN